MKYRIIVSFLVPLFCFASNIHSLDLTKLEDKAVVEILNNADHKWVEMGNYSEVILRMYSIPKEGSCVPETHAVCSHTYYLAAKESDMGGYQFVYSLGSVGEIQKIEHGKVKDRYTDNLILTISNYPSSALENNSKLTKRTREVVLEINSNGITKRK